MGASQSAASQHPTALHVLRVSPQSPAALAGVEPFFDYIIGLVGAESGLDPDNLGRIVESYEGRTLSLRVFSAKTQSTRLVSLTPSRAWSLPHTQSAASKNPHDPLAQPSLLGLSLRLCEPAQALEHVWHILDVLEGSPAESAGLVPYGDWIVGWSGGVLGAESDFYDLVEAHIDKPLRVYVYSYDFDTLREVVLIPNRMWGGEGLLGCGVGYGLLHRIPKVEPHVNASHPSAQAAKSFSPSIRHNTVIPEEEEEEEDEERRGEAGEMFVPADVRWDAQGGPVGMDVRAAA